MQDCSPTFFMISGALLLEKDESIGDIYKKRVSRIFAALLIFSLFQYSRQISNNTAPAQLSYFIEHFYTDPIIIPYWFLYQYISFLIILPFLRKMVRRMERRDYIYGCQSRQMPAGFRGDWSFLCGLQCRMCSFG